MVEMNMIKIAAASKKGQKASFIAGLRYGSDELDLVCLNDDAFQTKMEELDNYFTGLKAEILLVRQKGYQNTACIAMPCWTSTMYCAPGRISS